MRQLKVDYPFLLLPLIIAVAIPVSVLSMAHIGEYDVKAALVMNFARFTNWPAKAFNNETADLQICVYGDDNVINAFKVLHGKQIGARQLTIINTRRVIQANSCHMIFFSGTNRNRLRQLLTVINKKPILTIGEMIDFTSSGGGVGLKKINNKIHIIINLRVVRESGLKISSRLLKLATIVAKD